MRRRHKHGQHRNLTPGAVNPTYAPEARCIYCGCPCIDHVAIRYAIRAWLLHLLPARIAKTLRPLRRQQWHPTY